MIIQPIRFLIFIWLGAFFLQCSGGSSSQGSSKRSKNKVKVEVNNLQVEFSIADQVIKTTDDFQAQAVFTNKSKEDLRLNALFLEFAPILLKTRKIDGTPVNPGSPPFPPEDDGNVGRIILKPEQSEKFSYRGVDYFGEPLPEGKYQVRFIYQNPVNQYGDWTGKIETDWINFEIRRPKNQS